MVWVVFYLLAIVLANFSVAYFGPTLYIFNSFVLIGLDLSSRDALHDLWHERNFKRNMTLLILSGSLLSAALSIQVLPVAVASFVAFSLAGIADTLTYERLFHKAALIRMNGSNVVSAAVDSLVFSILAFGFPLLWDVIIIQYLAKIAGGYFWSRVIVLMRRTLNLQRART